MTSMMPPPSPGPDLTLLGLSSPSVFSVFFNIIPFWISPNKSPLLGLGFPGGGGFSDFTSELLLESGGGGGPGPGGGGGGGGGGPPDDWEGRGGGRSGGGGPCLLFVLGVGTGGLVMLLS